MTFGFDLFLYWVFHSWPFFCPVTWLWVVALREGRRQHCKFGFESSHFAGLTVTVCHVWRSFTLTHNWLQSNVRCVAIFTYSLHIHYMVFTLFLGILSPFLKLYFSNSHFYSLAVSLFQTEGFVPLLSLP